MPRPFALPGTRARYAPDRVVDVEHVKLELLISQRHFDEQRLEGTCAITLTPFPGSVSVLELDAVDLEIRGVTLDAPGRESLRHDHDGRRLRIHFARPLAAGQSTTLVIAYAAAPRRGLYFIAPDEAYPDRPRQLWSQGQDEDSRHWFPCFDAPHEKSTSELIVTVPSSFFALSNGDLLGTEETDLGRRFHWRFDLPHSCYLITLAAGELSVIEDRWEDISVSYYVEHGREDAARRALGRTPEMLALFSERFGLRYPYSKYAQVCVAEFIFGGMENTTATTLTDNVLFDERAALDFDMEALVAHELAHQWFGDLITCRDWGQGWLNEGFATYSEYLWREHAHGRDEAAMDLLDWADQYFGEDARRYRRPIVTNIYDEPIDVFDHHLYEKGGLVLHMLRRNLGDEGFWNAIGHYVRKHRTGSVETRDLARAVEEATGKSLDWFFDQWIQKAGHPELKVDYGWDGDARLARFSVKQTQKIEGETPIFRIPLEVRFRVNGTDITRQLELREASEVFYFPLDAAPTQAIFDTGQHTLKRVEIEKPRPLWLAELEGATDAADRLAAAKALHTHVATDSLAALEKALGGDPFWGVQAAAADALGQHRTNASRDALIRALATEHPKARRAVVKALGEYRRDEVAAGALEQIVRDGDASYFVEAEACLALGRTRSPRASAALRLALTRDSYLDVIRQHAYRGLAEARDDSALPLLLEGTAYGRTSQARRAALQAMAQLAQGRHDREARDVRERAEELLADPDFRVQQASVEALGVIADARALPALRRAVETNLDGRIRRRGREILRDLEEGSTREEEVKTLRDEVDRLRVDLVALRDRVLKSEKERPATPPPAARSRAKKAVKKTAGRAKAATALPGRKAPARPRSRR
jgi:aminopeptidase N